MKLTKFIEEKKTNLNKTGKVGGTVASRNGRGFETKKVALSYHAIHGHHAEEYESIPKEPIGILVRDCPIRAIYTSDANPTTAESGRIITRKICSTSLASITFSFFN